MKSREYLVFWFNRKYLLGICNAHILNFEWNILFWRYIKWLVPAQPQEAFNNYSLSQVGLRYCRSSNSIQENEEVILLLNHYSLNVRFQYSNHPHKILEDFPIIPYHFSVPISINARLFVIFHKTLVSLYGNLIYII